VIANQRRPYAIALDQTNLRHQTKKRAVNRPTNRNQAGSSKVTSNTTTTSSIIEPLDNEVVRGVNADQFEPFFTDGGESMRRIGFDHDYVTRTGKYLFPIDRHMRLAGADDANFGIRMFMQFWTFSRRKIAEEKGSASAIRLAFKLHSGDSTFPLIASMQDVEHTIYPFDDDVATAPCLTDRKRPAEIVLIAIV
jgi:hypothetical protein